ncbi:Eco29kI family restriction endonuclease [Micromonospora sp. HM134]|uniref:Eco29kI family restriction endonuclease n=1 Tax=Micromonospora sp. HM134 TaxID=2583243 RepID=UPI00119879C2|nr:Eco29kI family restriction endonuclease [Micromonospora sp. HM134]QDY11137.1 Eco29kI family restriction endonuclease [Micromonospora sp. HM134]
MSATQHFTFDLAGALAQQLLARLPNLTPEPLMPAHLATVEDMPGVYQLYRSGRMVYVGKADASLKERLFDHHKKLSGRENLSLAEMTYTGLYLEGTWIPIGPEQILIKHLEAEPIWNTNGFGGNDTGQYRDATNYKKGHFDVEFPANLNIVLQAIRPGISTVKDLILAAKRELPYTFRFEDKYARHPDYNSSTVDIPAGSPLTADELFTLVAHALPAGWQIVALPGYVVMYKNYPTPYKNARRVYHRPTVSARP